MRLATLMRRLGEVSFALLACASLHAQTSVSIHDIMVASPGDSADTKYFLPDSPYLYSHYGSTVSVSGIVVGVMTGGDFPGTFYISEPSSSWDNLVATAEGMPVFAVSGVTSSCAVVGNTVTVVGEVINANAIVPADITAADTPGTGILPTSCTVTSTGGTMTQSISLGSSLNTFGGALEYTGMTTSATFYAVAPTSGTTSASTGAATSTGQFWATLSSNTSTNNHLFRSAGIAGDEYVPSTAPSTVATWAGNPQRILIDTTTFGGSAVNLTVGQSITCTTGSNIKVGATAGIGLIDYTLGYARLLIFPTSVCTVSGTVATTTSATADSTHFHVGTLDVNAFYSTPAAIYSTRLSKAAQAIVNSLGKPDIVSLQEVQDLPTLTDIATATNTLGGVTYTPYLVTGNDPNNLNLGFLVNSSTLVTDSVTQVEKSSTYTTTSGTTATLWERPPLVLKAEFVRTGKNYPVTVIDVHLTPRTNIGDATLGPDIRNHRAAQAIDLSSLVQSYQTAGANVIVAGNLNAFEFNDGYVDVTGIVDGSPAAASAVTLYKASNTTGALTDFITSVAATSRYNIIERGDAEVLEHILASATVSDTSTASASLASYLTSVTQPHFTADFAAIDANSSTTPAGLTPHDGLVTAFLIPPVPTTASISASAINFGDVDLGASATNTLTVTNTTTFTSTVNITNIAITGTNASDFTQTSNCTSLAEGATCTVTVTFSPTAIGTRTATLTVTNDSTSDPTLTTALSGTGIDTTATLTPTTATFPSTDIGATSAAQVFTFTNTSASVALTVGTPTVSGDYAISTNTCTASIAVGATCTISVTFSPTVAGTRTGTLTVPNSSTGAPTLTASLTGTGLDTTATLSPITATFASTDVTAASASQTFTVTNTSAIAVKVNAPTITGQYAVTATTCNGAALAASATCTVTVVFKPTTVGTDAGTLTVTDASTGNPTLTASLTGTGLDTTATLTPTSATFANTYAGGGVSAAVVFTVTNTSTVSITLQTPAVSSANFTISATTCGTTLAASATCTISVEFTPTTAGALTATLTLANSTTADPVLTAALSGTGLPTTATLSPTSATYSATVLTTASAAQVFSWTNTSAIALTVNSTTTTGNFAVSSTTCTGKVAAGASCLVYVTFTPTALGTNTGTLIVASTSSANPTLTATLTGTGVADVQANVSALNFGNVDIGSTSAAQTVTVTNYTNAAIAFTANVITGDFAESNSTCGAVLAGLSSCTYNVTFTPTAIGARTGTITIDTNDTKYPVIVIALTGNGVDFSIAVSPTSGSTIAGYSVNPSVTLTPLGGYSGAITLSCMTTATGSNCTPGATSLTLSAATTIPVAITTTSQYTVIGYSGLGVGRHPRLALLALFAAGLLLLRARRRSVLLHVALSLCLLVAVGLGTTGCGSRDPDKNATPTYPGTYTYTLTATDGTLTHSATYTLTVTIR